MDPSRLHPFICPQADTGDDRDHVLRRRLDFERLRFAADDESNPFARYRGLLHSWHLGQACGLSDEEYLKIVASLDAEVRRIEGEGRGFNVTPFERSDQLSSLYGFSSKGGIWIKDETGTAGGMHKSRHFMAVALYLEVVERVGLVAADHRQTPLTLAARGHGALSAAIVARAAGRPITAHLPPGTDHAIVDRIRRLDATVYVLAMASGFKAKDENWRWKYEEDLSRGALPFTAQTNHNGLSLEGGMTLGYELIDSVVRTGGRLDRLFLQAGTGSLAAACIQAFDEAGQFGLQVPLPRIHPIQGRDAHPLWRAWDRITRRIVRKLERALPEDQRCPQDDAGRARWIHERSWSPIVQEELAYAAAHRSAFAWAWEDFQRDGETFLDEETTDWLTIVEGTIRSGGWPVIVDESDLSETYAHAQKATGFWTTQNGTAGLSGLHVLARQAAVDANERVGVVLTGGPW